MDRLPWAHIAFQGNARSSALCLVSADVAGQVACLATLCLTCAGMGAGLLTPEQRERWNQFHGATALSKAVRAAVRFAPWTLKGLARLSESKLGGRALYYGVFKRLIGEA